MKGSILVAVSLSLYANFCIAQQDLESGGEKRFSIGFNEGHSYPEGEFAKPDPSKLPISRLNRQDTTHLGGYAQSGFHFDIYVAYKVVRHFSIMLSVGGNDIGYDINTLNSQYIQYFAPNTSVVTSGDSYYIVQYLIGPSANIPIFKWFSIEIKALAGLTSANYPSLTYLGLSETSIYTYPKFNGFGYNVGAGIKFITAQGHIGMHFNVNYAGSNFIFSNYSITTYTPTGDYISSSTYNVSKSMGLSLLQATLGLSLELQHTKANR